MCAIWWQKHWKLYTVLFFIWCCIPYVQVWEMYLSCQYCCHLMCICCILCLFVVNVCVFVVLSCVFVVSHVYFFCTSYVYLLYYVCIVVLTLDAGLLARSQYPESPANGHLDTDFSCFPVSTSEC
jgi:hypothetical protein